MDFKNWRIRSVDSLAFKLLCILSLVWCLYVPSIPELPYIAMPSHCAVLSEHTDAGGRYSDFFKISGIRTISSAFGLDPDAMAKDSGTELLIRLTTCETTLIGFSNSAGPDSEPVLFGASYCGWRGPLLKAMLATKWIPGLGRLDETSSGVKYLLIDPRDKEGLKAAFAIHDNTLLATLSRNPEAIRELEARARFKAPLSSTFHTARPWNERARNMHRFWFSGAHIADLYHEYEGSDLSALPAPDFIYARLDIRELSAKTFSAFATAETHEPLTLGGREFSKLKGKTEVSEILPLDQAALMVVLPAENGASLADEVIRGSAARFRGADSDSLIALFDDENASALQIRGVEIPAVTAFLPGTHLPAGALSSFGTPKGSAANSPGSAGAKMFPQSETTDIIYSNLKKAIRFLSLLVNKEDLKKELAAVSRSPKAGTIISSSHSALNRQFSSPMAGLSGNWQKWLNEHNDEGKAIAYMRIDVTKIRQLAERAISVIRVIDAFYRIEGVDRGQLSLLSDLLDKCECTGTLNAILFEEDEKRFSLEIDNKAR